MSRHIRVNKKISLKEYTYQDKEEFREWYSIIREDNYEALLTIWNRGIDIFLIYKKFFIWDINIGFISMINYSKLSNHEKEFMKMLGLPRKFSGLFINDMIVSTKQRHKGVGSLVVSKILGNKNIYILDPVDDGLTFWKKFGFEYNKVGKYAVLDNR